MANCAQPLRPSTLPRASASCIGSMGLCKVIIVTQFYVEQTKINVDGATEEVRT